MKKLLSIITLIAILATAFYTVPTSAATNSLYDQIVTISEDGNWGYIYLCDYNDDDVSINNHRKGEIAIVDYRGNKTEIIIPETLDGHPVIGVGDYYYEEYGGDVDVSLLFCDNVKITKITLPKTIRQIGEYINERYYGNVFRTIDYLFLKNSITEYVVDKNNPYFSSEDGVLYNKDKTQLIIYPAGKKDEVFTLPESVKSFGGHAFAHSKLKRVKNFDHIKKLSSYLFWDSELEEFPKMENLQEIEDGAFSDCDNLKSVAIPLKVDKIGYRAFWYCKNLEEVDFGEITTIESNAFAKCSALKEVALPKSCSDISDYAFSNCKKLESFNCHDLIWLGKFAFENCVNLKKINSENYKNKLNANIIRSNAFRGCTSLENLTINAKEIYECVFTNCIALKDISLENFGYISSDAFTNTAYVNNHKDGIVYIDDMALCYKKPAKPETYIEIKEGTKYIAHSCLYKLDNLKAIYLPSSLNIVGEFNLSDCKNLKRVYIAGENTVFKSMHFLPKNSSIKYYVKSNAHNIIEIFKEEKYNYTTNWDPEKVKNEEAIKAKEEILNEKPNTSEETTSSKNETISQNNENTISQPETETESTVSTDTESTISTENETENNDMKITDVKPKNNTVTVLIIIGSILLCIAGGFSAFFIYNKKRK